MDMGRKMAEAVLAPPSGWPAMITEKDRQVTGLMDAVFILPGTMVGRLQGLLGVPEAPYQAQGSGHRACRQVCSGLSTPVGRSVSFGIARLVADQISVETLPGMERIAWMDVEGA